MGKDENKKLHSVNTSYVQRHILVYKFLVWRFG